ncbi:hypothetical protein [Neptunicella marina]|uniref:Uncharacterized protein n=1 Tax=Neptunicella marina TaxID=2125989 RepID=A0A8J6IV03_9ALTE|nr:hypothetical protein [Neptunicella marina]MBC3766143.1 hypothetical protein [Neptunicella marina]
MANTNALEKNKQIRFVPKMENYYTSLTYEGMTPPSKNKVQSVDDLKRKYAR